MNGYENGIGESHTEEDIHLFLNSSSDDSKKTRETLSNVSNPQDVHDSGDDDDDDDSHMRQNGGDHYSETNGDGVVVEEKSAHLRTATTKRRFETTQDIVATSFFERAAAHMARNTCRYFSYCWILTIALSVVGMVVGNFSVDVNNEGWYSRGTLISDRETQILVVLMNQDNLAMGDETTWENVTENVQDMYDSAFSDRRRRLAETKKQLRKDHPWDSNTRLFFQNRLDQMQSSIQQQQQQQQRVAQSMSDFTNGTDLISLVPGLDGCDLEFYGPNMIWYENLWPIWQVQKEEQPSASALDENVLRDICRAEQNTQQVLVELGVCEGGCINTPSGCMPPFSWVLLARFYIGDVTFTKSCEDVAREFQDQRATIESQLLQCVADLRKPSFSFVDNLGEQQPLPASCPLGFHPMLVDDLFGTNDTETGNLITAISYTSTVFITDSYYDEEELDTMYSAVDRYDRSTGEFVIGAYDTQFEAFGQRLVDESLTRDMSMAIGSALVTTIAMLIHTRSPWLMLAGLFQVILSFPLAYFLYSIVGRLTFFPFLNFIAVFVLFALGADDVFVAVDKWKNARIDHPDATTEQISIVALPDAAFSMLQTSITTAIAFFGTAVCPVAPLRVFAIFNGLMIMSCYILCVFLFFPCLILYDRWLRKGCRSSFVSCHCCHRLEEEGRGATDDIDGDLDLKEDRPSLIRRIIFKYYKAVHCSRWVIIVLTVAAMAYCGYVASQLELPPTSDVRILDESVEYEKNYEWRQILFSTDLIKKAGSTAYVLWGARPADTGNHNKPSELSQLVLDDTFDPSSETAQIDIKKLCDDLFAEDFADEIFENYDCSINQFESWLSMQSTSSNPDAEYLLKCAGANRIPVAQEVFHGCILAWRELYGDRHVFHRNGVVEMMMIPYQSRVRYDSAFSVLTDEWNLIESWMNDKNKIMHPGVANMFFSSQDFWWHDTNGQILKSAYTSAAIAMCAAFVVILLASRSFEITCFAVIALFFILLSVTAILVGIGWTLGFLESVCFAILIGVSCDFVIHFGHAYSHLPGEHSRHERSKYALLRMGPSVLAAAITTFCAALIMLFTVITFFQKFAQILLCTVVMATVGSMFVFTALADAMGPSKPTECVDSMFKCCHKKSENTIES